MHLCGGTFSPRQVTYLALVWMQHSRIGAMRYFKSDNTAAVSREILQALAEANTGATAAYGADRWSERLDQVFGRFFDKEVRVFAVSSGTAANSLALATLCPPWGTVLTHEEAHVERDECGAPEFFTGGAKLSLVGGAGAKMTAQDLAARLNWFEPHVHGVQPRVLSLTQATERGAIYTPAEIAENSLVLDAYFHPSDGRTRHDDDEVVKGGRPARGAGPPQSAPAPCSSPSGVWARFPVQRYLPGSAARCRRRAATRTPGLLAP